MVARAAMVPVLEPSDSEEARIFTKLAFTYSEKYDTPVIVRTTTRLSHSQGVVHPEERENVPDKPYEKNIEKKCTDAGECEETACDRGTAAEADGGRCLSL